MMKDLQDVMVVGLTGQTGAGKSTVSKVFEDNGYAIINADLIARIVVEKGRKCLDELADFFGDKILNEDGTLNRRALADIVFTDKTRLETLNTIMYPYITEEILSQIRSHSQKGRKLILLDAPTLFESRADDFCEIIISVLADPEIRESRIIKRDDLTPKQARERMASQLDEEYFKEHSDYIIKNNDTLESIYGISKEVSDKIKFYYYHIHSVSFADV